MNIGSTRLGAARRQVRDRLSMSVMNHSAVELRPLVARAMPLHERFGRTKDATLKDSKALLRLNRWRQMLSLEADDEILAQRLVLDGLDRPACASILGDVCLLDSEPCPEWAACLQELLCAYSLPESAELVPARFIAPSLFDDWDWESVPFSAVWIPFVACATKKWRGRAGAKSQGLSESAVGAFQAQLLTALSHVASLPLSLEFRRRMAKRDPLSVFNHLVKDEGGYSRNAHERFVQELKGGELRGFFEQYADLARLMTGLVEHWADSLTEFCERLEQDREALAERFSEGTDPGRVAHVRIGVSDPHHGRRDVIIAQFASGLKLVYKPKDLSIDVAFWSFIDWFNHSAANENRYLTLRPLRVLNRGTYGWVEFVEAAACEDAEQMQRYYRRIGMLLGVGYVLGATDFHHENIIASGEQPVPVDLETLLQPLPRSFDGTRTDSADERAIEIMHDSVLRIGLLPFWISGEGGKSYDVSGIGSEGAVDTGHPQVQWSSANTDTVCPQYRDHVAEDEAKRPTIDGEKVSAHNYAAEIIDGFTCCYRALLARRDQLLAHDGPLNRFGGVRLRYLVRMTKAYAQLLNRRLHPEFLRDAADAGIEIERLARDFLLLQPDAHQPLPWNIFLAEAEALERLDIPAFSFLSDSETLYCEGRSVARRFFSGTGLQRVRSLIAQLGEADLRAQIAFIRASLHARYADDRGLTVRASTDEPPRSHESRNFVPSQELVATAVAIAEKIRSAAIRGASGGVTWLSMAFDPTASRMNFLPMSDNLYDGRTGVALFLAALERATGGAGFRDLALDAVQPLRRALRQRIPAPVFRIGLGAAAGLGSWVYALVRISGWLMDEELLTLAERAAAWCAPQRIASDDNLDVFGGAAGGILGLLALADAKGPGALERAVQCGDHLLRRRVATENGQRAWPGRWTERPLTGFGHGVAGIACALLRLAYATGELRFREAAEEAMAFEHSVYSPGLENWPDFRTTREGVPPMVAWCNGAAGIGLGRLRTLPMLDTWTVRQDIERALGATCAYGFDDEDHLCCGNAGRLDLLMEASQRLNRADLWSDAHRRAGAVISRAQRLHAGSRCDGHAAEPDSFSLFQGTAGIGYQLLRLAEPGRMPSVLLWD